MDRVKEDKETPLSSSTPVDASIRLDVREEASTAVNVICEMLTVDEEDIIRYGLNEVWMVV